LELLNLSLYVLSQGPVVYKGEHFSCMLEDEQMRATVAVAMGAGQSLDTILKNSTETGIGVRDLYPIARAVIEGFINAAFFITQPVEVAQRALKHCAYAAWKHHHRVVGAGELLFTIGDDPDPKATIQQLFPEFAGRGQDSWSSLSAPAKIERIGKVVRASGSALLGAYGAILCGVVRNHPRVSVWDEVLHERQQARQFRCRRIQGQHGGADGGYPHCGESRSKWLHFGRRQHP